MASGIKKKTEQKQDPSPRSPGSPGKGNTKSAVSPVHTDKSSPGQGSSKSTKSSGSQGSPGKGSVGSPVNTDKSSPGQGSSKSTKSSGSPGPQKEKDSDIGFYSDSNPNGYIRKVEYRNLEPDVPFFIFNLERQLGDYINKSYIRPSQIIGIGDARFNHKATVIFSGSAQQGHYTTVFNCSDPDDPSSDNWYYYDDMKPRISMVATSHEELLKKLPEIMTNGVLHFYTNQDQEVESIFNPCATLGPLYSENSCYMDSTILAIFALSNQYLLKLLLNEQLNEFNTNVCPKQVKERIREVLTSILDYFMSGKKNMARKFCTDLRLLFNQCRFKTYENFGNTEQRSPSEFLSYLFQIFNVEGPGQVKFTWGTYDLEADPDSLFGTSDNPDKESFAQTSINDTNFNYIIEIGPYKLSENNGKSTNDLLASVDDILLLG
jgi:hypothetical protein